MTAYDLEVVPSATDVDETDYFTLSAGGVSKFDSHGSEFTPLPDWEQEFALFHRALRVPFFARYQAWKGFTVWKKSVVRRKQHFARSRLTKGLFHLCKPLRRTLVRLQRLCEAVRSWKLFHAEKGRVYTLDEFVAAQTEKRRAVAAWLQDFLDDVRALVRAACDEVLDGFLDKSGIRGEDRMTFMERAALRKECARLARFIRLADFLVRDTLLSLALESARFFHKLVDPAAFESGEVPPHVVRIDLAKKATELAHMKAPAEGSVDGGGSVGGAGGRGDAPPAALPLLTITLQMELERVMGAVPLKRQKVVTEDEFDLDLDDAGEQPRAGGGAPAAGTPKLKRGPGSGTGAAAKAFAGYFGDDDDGDDSDEEGKEEGSDEEDFDPNAEYEMVEAVTEEEALFAVHHRLDMQPSQQNVRSRLAACLSKGMAILSATSRLLSHRDLQPYTAVASDEMPAAADGEEDEDDLARRVVAHPDYRHHETGIFAAVDRAFAEVGEYARVFAPFVLSYIRNAREADDMGMLYKPDTPLEDLNKAIEKYQGQVDNFNTAPYSSDIGVLHLDSEALKRALLPSPTQCLDTMREVIPQLINKGCEAIMTEAKEMTAVLEAHPEDVEGFVSKVGTLNRASERLPVLRDQEAHTRQLAQMMISHRWAVPKQEQALLRMLRESVQALEDAASAFEVRQNEDTMHFRHLVEQAIADFKKEVMATREALQHPKFSSAETDPTDAAEEATGFKKSFADNKDQYATFQRWQEMLKLDVIEWERMEDIEREVQLLHRLWTGLRDWDHTTADWRATPITRLETGAMERKVNKFLKTAMVAGRMLANNHAAEKLKADVSDFKTLLPLVTNLRCDKFQEHHYQKIEEALGIDISPPDEGAEDDEDDMGTPKDAEVIAAQQQALQLGSLLDGGVLEQAEAIEEIATEAVQEAALLDLFNRKVSSIWADLPLEVKRYKDAKGVYILGAPDEVLAALDESLVAINTILGSRFVGPIRGRVEKEQKRLRLLGDTLDEWLQCQKQWMYLETIFSAEDIQRQLPEESKRFNAVDKSWKAVMKRTYDQPTAIVAGTVPGLKDLLGRHNQVLDAIQKSLEDYLETKRSAFPRFYFLSDDELLEILAQTRDPQAVQPHLRKCFDALVRLHFGEGTGSSDILAMQSPKGEVIQLPPNLRARGNVEEWLSEVERGMQLSLQRLIKEGVEDYHEAPSRGDWVTEKKGQVVGCVSMIAWSSETEAALNDREDPLGKMQAWYEKNVRQLAELTELVRSDLAKLQRSVVVALITTDVHGRDIIERMVQDKVDTVGSFTWQQQLRYYFRPRQGDVVARQSDSEIVFGYEYQGCASRLVITPLTDRCWMTITGAFSLRLGASPAGPAGTGKTESSKDLAKALGIQCIVFNCSDQITYKQMGKHFAGLAQGGAWTCLDEFNRIDIEVLSVVAQQLQQLRVGMLEGQPHMQFEGRHIRLRRHMVIITMNPGYAGRTELPDNLKILFRPVAMMVPDYALIAEIILFAEGFSDTRDLARKMTRLYRLSSEQLSQQRHYDFGMRAVKSVLVMAGALKRKFAELPEDVVLIRAMQESNVPKFLKDDLPLFHAIVGDLFPDSKVPASDYGHLEVTIREVIAKRGLQPVPAFITKVIQLFETFQVRFGVVLTGPTGGGKTTAYNVLQEAMTTLHASDIVDERMQPVHTYVLNPKCISMGELYGEVNPVTQEWTDGLASSILRSHVADETEDKKWTVFDGPIDALWIENMNTVLDDNQTLCLANGQRIKLKSAMRMLFEVEDLDQASPATVSRLGVVYVTPDDLGWRPYVKTWLALTCQALVEEQGLGLSEALAEHLLHLFTETIDDGLHFRSESCQQPIESTPLQTVTSLCSLLHALARGDAQEACDPSAHSEEELKRAFETLFAFCFVWSVGGSITGEGFHAFDEFARHQSRLATLRWGGSGTVYEQFPAVADGALVWRGWETIMPEFNYDPKLPYFALVVPTIDTVRFDLLLKTQVEWLRPVFLTGVTGTGKTVIVEDYLNRTSDEAFEGVRSAPIVINFSAQTPAKGTQLTIEEKLEKKKKDLLGAPAGQRAVVFVDDVNMPQVETYGAQPPVELLRQFCDFRGFYDREKLFWRELESTTLVCAAAPPGGGRAPITKRLTRHFHMLCVPAATDTVLKGIFGAILTGFLETGGFADECRAAAPRAVAATIELYTNIAGEMRPTPAKSHYTFNLRDVSKVFQGMLMVDKKGCPSSDVLARLWAHETLRVFHDRLVNDQDKGWLTAQASELLKRSFGKVGEPWEHDALFASSDPLLFVDFMTPAMEEGERGRYEECRSEEKLGARLQEALEDYNMQHPSQMNLVFFRDAVEHVARISRILRQPRGNAMLIGVGGSGKQSLTRMACALADMSARSIELTRGYGLQEFRDDLKSMMLEAGVEGKQVVFLFLDTQIKEESFLEDVNNVLNTGEVPSLWEQEERTQILDGMRGPASKAGIPGTPDNLYRLFISRVRDNLHIVLAMSPVGDMLRVRCRQFPSLINCCTIDWFSAWPRDALLAVSEHFLLKEELLGEEQVRRGVASACVDIHLSVSHFADTFYDELQRRVYTTPKSYLDLLGLYKTMLAEKKEQLGKQRHVLATGVTKLEATNEMVAAMKIELTELQPQLDKKQAETAKLMEEVAREKADADVVKDRVEKEKEEVASQQAEVAAIQSEAQAELDEALPAMRRAQKDLEKLDKGSITEVRSFAKPPPTVQRVLEGVCILLGENKDWDSAKKVMADAKFLERIKTYDAENADPKRLRKVQPYVQDEELEPKVVESKSKAAGPLSAWIRAVDTFSRVIKEVEPKKARLREMNEQLERANADLAQKESALQEVLDKVAGLERQAKEAKDEADRLVAEKAKTVARLTRADQLTSGLADEQVRWKASVETLDSTIGDLVGSVLLAAASISYYGPFTGAYRADIVAQWLRRCQELEIPVASDYSLQTTMGDPVQIRQWQIDGLPTDTLSADNGVLVTRGRRWPLMIDPQEQAKRWIKNMEAKNRLAITRLTNPNMLRTMETCIRNGRPILVEDIQEFLDPALEPVLARAVFKSQGLDVIRFGDSLVPYDHNFKLYVATKLPNPHYLPEVCIKVTVINFTVTMDGLVDQLLGAVVSKERADIERRKNSLLVSMAGDKRQLKELEDKILRLLSESGEGEAILDDELLINALGESKELSTVIGRRLKESEKTQEEIQATREGYRSVAQRGAIIYFVMADLARIDPMYQFSLSYFSRLYELCIEQSEPSDQLSQRLTNLIDFLTASVYENVCRGLFEKDKLIFSFLITVQVLRQAGQVSDGEWFTLLRGAGMVVNTKPNPMDPKHLSQNGWNLLFSMEADMPQLFAGIGDHVTQNKEPWVQWCEADEPHKEPLPAPWRSSLNSMQKLLVLRAFREEKLVFAIKDFVVEQLGRKFVEPPPTRMAQIHAESTPDTPVIFILSVGADPTGMLLSYAKQQKYTERLRLCSLGQGQGPRATRMIAEACRTGDWVLLMNCHLAKSWMPDLEKICDRLGEIVAAEARARQAGGGDAMAAPVVEEGGLLSDVRSVHKDFRLFLTSMPAPYFPVPVLQNGIKLTNEPPKGIRANLTRSLSQLDGWTPWDDCEGSFETGDEKLPAWKRLAFSLCFFHAVVQERRKFGPLGFNIRYEFNDSDLETSTQVLKRLLSEQPVIPWDAMTYVTGQINYGGRVTDDWDRRCLMTILTRFYDRAVVKPAYSFSESGTYYIPELSTLEELRKYVEALPGDDPPEIFGMHANANVTFQANESDNILKTCLSIQPRTGGAAADEEGEEDGGGGDAGADGEDAAALTITGPDAVVSKLAAQILEELPSDLLRSEAGTNTFVMKGQHMDSLATVLMQEMARFNRLLREMRSSLSNIQRAIRGEVLMSDVLDAMYTALLNNQVPGNWEAVAFASLKPLASWVKDLHARITMLRTWLVGGQPPVFWLSGFYFPQGFMTGVLQNHARKYSQAIDTLSFSYDVRKAYEAADIPEEEVPTDGILVHGLYFDGARWDSEAESVVDSRPGEMFSLVPVLHFIPTQHYEPPQELYSAPLYKTSVRAGTLSTTGISTNFVVSIHFPTVVDPNSWVLKGVALLCALND